jgi:Fis family transcriptional regulator, factor for inversion stimulation protein
MSKKNIEDSVRYSLDAYFKDLGNETPHDLYNMMLSIFEKPMLEVVMRHAENNQSRAAEWLGMNRNTLRKKLAEYQML